MLNWGEFAFAVPYLHPHSSPWLAQGYQYASDHHLMIRQEVDPSLGVGAKAPRGFAGFAPERCTMPLPEASGETRKAPCKKEHLVEKMSDCPCCRGSGTHESDADGVYEYTVECSCCGGRGQRQIETPGAHPVDCECKGTGVIRAPADERFGGLWFCGFRLARIRRNLRGVRYRIETIIMKSLPVPAMFFVADLKIEGIMAGRSAAPMEMGGDG